MTFARGVHSMFFLVLPIATILSFSCSRAPEQNESLLRLRQAKVPEIVRTRTNLL